MTWLDMLAGQTRIVAHDDDRQLIITWDKETTMFLWTFKMDGTFTRWAQWNLTEKPKRTRDAERHARRLIARSV